MPIFSMQVKRTHKFSLQVTADDAQKAALAAKEAVKNGSAIAVEYDVKFNIFGQLIDPETLPPIP